MLTYWMPPWQYIIDEAVKNRHRFVGDTCIGMDLFICI